MSRDFIYDITLATTNTT